MPRAPRSGLPDGYFHVFTRGVAGSIPFPTPEDRNVMLELIPSLEWRNDLVLHVACVMSTHYHHVSEGTSDALSNAMHWLNWAYARYFNEKYDLHGHVFSERFQTRIPDGEDGVRAMCDYVLDNPVKAGLCIHRHDWPWSFSRYGTVGG